MTVERDLPASPASPPHAACASRVPAPPSRTVRPARATGRRAKRRRGRWPKVSRRGPRPSQSVSQFPGPTATTRASVRTLASDARSETRPFGLFGDRAPATQRHSLRQSFTTHISARRESKGTPKHYVTPPPLRCVCVPGGVQSFPCAPKRRVGRPRKGSVLGGGAAEAERTRRRRRCRGGGGGQMRRDRARGAAGGPHHTHTLDVEARPKTEGRPRQQQVGEHTAPPPPPPRLRLRRACVVCTHVFWM